MSKRVLSIIFAVVLIVSAFPVFASAVSNNGFSYKIEDGCAVITGYNIKYGTDVVVPDYLGGCPVTEITNRGLCYSEITSVALPITLKTLGEYSLSGEYTSIYIPKSVTEIDSTAFQCPHLLSINVDTENEVYSSDDGILYSKDKSVLVACPGAKKGKFRIPDSVTEIGDYAFCACDFTEITGGINVERIGKSAFLYCLKLTKIELHENLRVIEENAFGSCNKANINDYTLPEGLEEIHASAFRGCWFTSLTIPKTVKYIDSLAFDYAAREIIISSDNPYYTKYGQSIYNKDRSALIIAVSNCSNYSIKSYVIQSTVKTVDPNAFCNLILDSIYVDTSNPYLKAQDGVLFNYDMTSLIKCPRLESDSYEIPKSVKRIEELAFDCSYSISKLIFPDGLEYIGSKALTGFSGTVTIPKSVNYISPDAFRKHTPAKIIAPYNSYAYKYALKNYVNNICSGKESYTINDKGYTQSGNMLTYYLSTGSDVDRIKASYTDDINSYFTYSNNYRTNENGERIFTLTIAPQTRMIAFDARIESTGRYAHNYHYDILSLDLPDMQSVKDVSHKIENGKIVFSVTSKWDIFDRVKLSLASDKNKSIAIGTSYTVDEDGNFVWTVKTAVPTESTIYSFDFRDSESGKYLKDYFEYEVDAPQDERAIKSVESKTSGNYTVFTVVTKSGDFNRLRCGTSKSVKDNLANANSYTVNSDGDFVWTLKIPNSAEYETLYFDLKSADTGLYLRDFYLLNI